MSCSDFISGSSLRYWLGCSSLSILASCSITSLIQALWLPLKTTSWPASFFSPVISASCFTPNGYGYAWSSARSSAWMGYTRLNIDAIYYGASQGSFVGKFDQFEEEPSISMPTFRIVRFSEKPPWSLISIEPATQQFKNRLISL